MGSLCPPVRLSGCWRRAAESRRSEIRWVDRARTPRNTRTSGTWPKQWGYLPQSARGTGIFPPREGHSRKEKNAMERSCDSCALSTQFTPVSRLLWNALSDRGLTGRTRTASHRGAMVIHPCRFLKINSHCADLTPARNVLMITNKPFGRQYLLAALIALAVAPASAPAAGITVLMTPSYATLAPSQTQQFQAFIGGAANTAVTWTVVPQIGSLTAAGLYTAPSSVLAQQTIVMTATSLVDPTAKANCILITVNPPAKPQATTLATFSLPELFGVAWPDQPVEFRYDGGAATLATTRMIGPAGTEVPYQWVSSCSDAAAVKGCIVVRSSLPANSNYTGLCNPAPLPPPRRSTPCRSNKWARTGKSATG